MNDLPMTSGERLPTGVVMGAFARVEESEAATVRGRLQALADVTLFDLKHPGKVGLLVEADSLEEAHHRLTREVAPTEGVLGVWPVSVELDDPSAVSDSPSPTALSESESPIQPTP